MNLDCYEVMLELVRGSWDVSSNNIEKPSTIAGLLQSSNMDLDGIRAGMMRPVLLAKRQPWVQSLRKVAVKKMLIMDGEQKESFEKEAQIMSLELMDKLCFVFWLGLVDAICTGISYMYSGLWPKAFLASVKEAQACFRSRASQYVVDI